MTGKKICALIPAYCEERFIGEVVAKTRSFVDAVFVVDDGSPDGTAAAAAAAGATVLYHQSNLGKGAAIKTGLRELVAREYEYILMLDGDLQHDPREIPGLVQEALEANAALVLGTRDYNSSMPLIRKLTNRMMSGVISFFCRQRIPDSQCGFRLIRTDLARIILARSRTDHFEMETEMLMLAAMAGFAIASARISTIYGNENSSIRKIPDTLRFLRLMIRYGIPLLFSRLRPGHCSTTCSSRAVLESAYEQDGGPQL